MQKYKENKKIKSNKKIKNNEKICTYLKHISFDFNFPFGFEIFMRTLYVYSLRTFRLHVYIQIFIEEQQKLNKKKTTFV